MHKKLNLDFYTRDDTILIAKELLGKYLCTYIDGIYTSGIITETESYLGINDKASHAFGNRLTNRTKTMYEKGGVAYIYLCYGIHHLFNVVTSTKNIPNAVLIRAIKPHDGIDEILKRRKFSTINSKIAAGPGTLSKALGITTKLNNISLLDDTIWIEDRNLNVSSEIKSMPRVGVDYAKEDALLPYRFKINESDLKRIKP